MNGAHIHLILNHLPIAGVFFSILLLPIAWRSRSEDLKRASLLLVVVTGLLTIPVFLSGDPAEDVVKLLPGITKTAIHLHEDAAEKSAWLVWGTSLVALAGLWISTRKKVTPKWVIPLVLALSLGCLGLLGLSNNLGGQISHPEIREK